MTRRKTTTRTSSRRLCENPNWMNSVSYTRYGGPRATPSGLFGFREARALNQAAPAVDLRCQEFLQLGRRPPVDRDGANPNDYVANLRRCGHRLEFGVQPIDHRFGRCRRRADHRPSDGIKA